MTDEPCDASDDDAELKACRRDARLYGLGFLKDGKRVAPETMYLTNPDTAADWVRDRFAGCSYTYAVEAEIVDGRFIHIDTLLDGKGLAHKMIDAEEKAIRAALIALGWTPPA